MTLEAGLLSLLSHLQQLSIMRNQGHILLVALVAVFAGYPFPNTCMPEDLSS